MVKTGIVPGIGSRAGEKTYSFVCVFDLIKTISLSLQRPTNKTEIFFSSYPDPITFKALLDSVANSLQKRKALIVPLPTVLIKLVAKAIPLVAPKARLTTDKLKEMIPPVWLCSCEKSISQLGQSYEWNLDKTIEITLKDYQGRGWL
jgi:NAD dependent epimerase/dehydratase family enzyme